MTQSEEIEKRIGVTLKNKDLLTQAFMHRSFVVENHMGDLASNERLEFLGDAVLEIAVSDFLYRLHETKAEGILTQWRSMIVNTKTLAEVCKDLDLGQYIFLSRGEKSSAGFEKERILANILEALIGAIYVDSGYAKAEAFIKSAILSRAETLLTSSEDYNPKGILQEKIQAKKRLTPEYQVIEERGPDHRKMFLCAVFLEGEKLGEGKGKSKKEAEEDAARSALQYLHTKST